MASAQEAEQIVRDQARRYGYLDERMMDEIGEFNAAYRKNIDKNWLAIESVASHSVKVLAKQIYGSGARFVFELLQNAEDNVFKKAIARKELPFISFKIHPDRIIVDCNEDGFTERDVVAICNVGKSTKSATHGYIGAKGIGFKSVFIAASRVHIQSGNFSFEFRHRKTDPGIGMVRPIWVDPVETIPNPLTRMTLYIHSQGDQGEIEHLKRIISIQLDDLQETCLLFLRKLKQITLEFYDDQGELKRSKRFRKHEIDEYRVSLDTTCTLDGEETVKRRIYHITKQTATGLPRSDNREVPDTDEASSTAEVVLAFPLENTFKPYIPRNNQDLFAFLPLRRSDYKFLIHSDFDTNANRQDIVTTSRRNLALRAWVATAFFQAVLQFCEHPVLCYEWPLFLPRTDTSSDWFWSGLDREIQDLMKKRPVLRSRNRHDLRLIREVRILPPDAIDRDGQPLLDDPVKDLYLSPKYRQVVKKILSCHGLEPLSVNMMIDLLEADLRAAGSKIHGKHTTSAWHSDLARLLSSFFQSNFYSWKRRLLLLPLIPLRNGNWTSTASGQVYFPKTGDIDIPEYLDLRVVSRLASEDPHRNTLFQHLGVHEATVDTVRASILSSFILNVFLLFRPIKPYLEYLYLTHQPDTHTREDYSEVKVIDDCHVLRIPQETDVYLPSMDHAYSPMSLWAIRGTAPGLSVAFLHSELMSPAPNRPTSSHPGWEKWLCDFVGIRERLRLLSRNGDSLSDTFLYVFEHLPGKFLGLFEHLWLHEKSNIVRNRSLRSQIESLSAKDLCDVTFPLKLKETWLPFPYLLEHVARYMDHPREFPFLKFEESAMPRQSETRWNFLSQYFSVGKDDSLDFLLEILRCIERSCPEPSSVRQTQKVFDLYVAIYARLAVSDDEQGTQQEIWDFFVEQGILVPNEDNPTWTSIASCLWVAPADMVTAHSLRNLYSRRLGDEQLGNIENLFQRTLSIEDASLTDLTDELEELREMGCEDQLQIRAIYKYLDEHIAPTSEMRDEFEEKPLIFHVRRGESGWHKTSDCLWSSETPIRGKALLDECWEDDVDFFVNKLGVKLLTLQMVYDELRQSPQSGIEEIKVALLSFNGLLQTESTTLLDPEPIRKAKIFPVRYPNGSVMLSSVEVDFAIGDREVLTTKFQDQISLLDFDMGDVRRLKPLFKWLGLQGQYLSRSVTERTAISSDSGSPIPSSNRDLKRKAYYIARVAATFDSPRFRNDERGLYEQLRTMTIMEVDGISSVLEMHQNRRPFQVKVATANEHIDDTTTPGKLTIYVPRERTAQELCFCSVLPTKLAAWLMRDSESSTEETVEVEPDLVTALTSIFASHRSALDHILGHQGIQQVSFSNEDQGDEDEHREPEVQEQLESDNPFPVDDSSSEHRTTPTHFSMNDGSSQQVESSDVQPEEAAEETVIETISRQSNMSNLLGRSGRANSPPPTLVHRPSPLPGPSSYQDPRYLPPTSVTPLQNRSPEDVSYLAVLNRVVEKARTAAFPSRGTFDMSEMREALSGSVRNEDTYERFDGLDVMSRFRSTNQLERDKKVGAAGELYVFELLSQLDLVGWGRANWQSTIRTYVTIHPDYTDMGAWSRRETADLVYLDSSGNFTNTLIGCGYLDHDQWHGARPKYYIEVKTTTGPCNTPFYMSGNQYQLMGRIHHAEDRSEVYMIFRVFWLNSDRIGLCVYFDPEQLRQDGRLVFTGQTWSVSPGAGTEAHG